MDKEYHKIVELAQQLAGLRVDHWLDNVLFSLNWWILFCITSVLLIVWLIMLDKKRIIEIVAYGFMVAMIGVLGDVIGVTLVLWQYPYALVPIPMIAGIHVIMMPVIYMIMYQCFNKWKPFLIAVALNAFVFTFVLEPILMWLQIYEIHNWNYMYSFLPYVIIAVVFKWLINHFKQLDQNYKDVRKENR